MARFRTILARTALEPACCGLDALAANDCRQIPASYGALNRPAA
ncbi:hypothetical protein [Methylobacterium sp. CM6257]